MSTEPTTPEFLTVREFADRLGVTVGLVERWYLDGKVTIGTLDGARVLPSTDVGRAEFARITGNWPKTETPAGPAATTGTEPPPAESPTEVIHIAGPDVQVGQQLRQRCSWCGAVLLDYALDLIAVPVDQDPRPATWPVGELVAVDGGAQWTVPHVDGEPLPAGACASIDHEVTR